MDTLESGQRYLDGWALTYNHSRDHEGAGREPPAVRAKVKFPYTEGVDVVRGKAVNPVEQLQHKRISAIEEPEFRVSLKPGITLLGAPPVCQERRTARKSASGYTPAKVNVWLRDN